MRDPALYKKALAALDKLCQHQRGEYDGYPVHVARCASLVAALDWVLFVLQVAGQDAHVARSTCQILIDTSYGLYKSGESIQPLLRAVAPVLTVLQTHKDDAAVVNIALYSLRNLSIQAPVRGKLRELGVLDAVREAGKNHPQHVGIQTSVNTCLKNLAR
jgi:hypothetical protein